MILKVTPLLIVETLLLFIFLCCYFLQLGIFSAIIFFGYLLILFSIRKAFIIKYFYFHFLILTNILGVIAIEYLLDEVYLYEVATYSSNAQTLPPLLLIFYIFLLFLKLFDAKFDRKFISEEIKVFTPRTIYAVKVILLLLIFVLLLRVLNKPFFLLGYDRFAYQKNILTSVEILLGSLLSWSMPIVAINFNKNKYLSSSIIVFSLFYYFWTANKFSVFIIFAQLMFVLLVSKIDFSYLKKLSRPLIFLFALLFSVVILQSMLVNGRSFQQTVQYFLIRLSQQGQLWWGIVKDYSGELRFSEAMLELSEFFRLNETDNVYYLGMFKTMRLVAPERLVELKIAQGSRYAAANPAILYYYFGLPLTTLLMAGYAFVISKLAYLMRLEYIRDNFLNLILYSKLFIVLIRSFSNADFHIVFSLETIITLLLTASVNYIAKMNRRS